MTLVKWFRRHPRFCRLVQLFVIAVPLAFIFWSTVANWQAVRSYDWQFNGIIGGSAVLCLMAAFGLLPLVTQRALSGLGHPIDYRTAYRGYFVSQLAKYLPGGLWIIPGRVLIFSQIGVNVISSSAGMVIELCMLLVSGVVVFLPYLLLGGTQYAFQIWIFGVLLAAVILLSLHPRIFNPALQWLLKRIGYANATININGSVIVSMLLIDMAFWLSAGTGFFLLVSSVQPIPMRFWLVLISAFSMAWVLGFLAFLTPGGLGVREGALALLLVPFFPAPLPAVAALLARLWWTVAELISVAIAALVRENYDRREIQP